MLLSQNGPTKGFRAAKSFYGNTLNIHTRGFVSAQRSQASSSSSSKWQSRQVNDKFAKLAKVQGLKSRAAYKLLEVGFRNEAVGRWLMQDLDQ